MNVSEELAQKWAEIERAAPGGTEWRAMRLSTSQSLTFYAGVRERDGRKGLLLELPAKSAPAKVPRFNSDAISLTDARDGLSASRYRLAIVLEKDNFLDIFLALATDVILVGAGYDDERKALEALLKRLDAWRACFRARLQGLSQRDRIALFGELVVLQNLATIIGFAHAIDCWMGPRDGLHDFHGEGVSLEVKTVSGVGRHVHISTLDQLETAGLSALLLARPRLAEGASGKSLPELVEEVRASSSEAGSLCRENLDGLLIRARYLSVDTPHYSHDRFTVFQVRYYRVTGGFPRIPREHISPGVLEGSYVIDEGAMEEFSVLFADASNFLQKMV